ncbi:MAG: glucosamine-6-phosphate deaminase [Ferruginibacter sp.]
MDIDILKDPVELGKAAGAKAAQLIRAAIAANGSANIILATGTSQFETLNQLIKEQEIDWSKVVMFHLDEYIDLPITHPASFRKYLQERFLSNVPALKSVYLVNGERDATEECAYLGSVIRNHPIDVALIGIGENGHLAFNDPPADFETEHPYIIVELNEACRKQQMGEGWFKSVEEVPSHAISMSVKQIMKSKQIICSVPDSRKALAVKNTIQRPVSNLYPASILQLHPNCICYLDTASAALLSASITT